MWGYVDNTIANDYTSYLNRWGGAAGFTSKYSEEGAVLDAADDAAMQISGGDYRMPTLADWKELKDNCDWRNIWATTIEGYEDYGVKDWEITGKNGEKIFLPYTTYSQPSYGDTDGLYYWSSTYRGYYEQHYLCDCIYYHGETQNLPHTCGGYTRMPIRPVKDAD